MACVVVDTYLIAHAVVNGLHKADPHELFTKVLRNYFEFSKCLKWLTSIT